MLKKERMNYQKMNPLIRVKWSERKKLNEFLKFKGIYRIYMNNELVYIGMSCNKEGLDGRFTNAQQSLKGLKNKHSGFESMIAHYGMDYLLEFAEVEIIPFVEFPNSLAETHELHGRIKLTEELYIADHIRHTGNRPRFNKI